MNARPLIALSLLTLASHATPAADASSDASEDGLTMTLGVVRSLSSLSGESRDKPEVSPLVALDYRSGRFFASTSMGVGYDLVKIDGLTVFAAAGFQSGRKESRAGNKDDNPRLVGMGKVSGSGLLIAGAVASPFDGLLQLSAVVLRSTRSEQGLTASFGAGVGFPLWGPVSGSFQVETLYADKKHTQTFYGVTAAQSLRSGNPVFTPKAGWASATVSAGLNWEIDKHWAASASVGRQQLRGDAEKSPLFKNKNDTVSSLSLSYRF